MSVYAKAIYATVLAALLAAQSIYVGNPVLTIVLAAVTAIGVYVIPNKPTNTDVSKRVDTL